MATPKVTLKKMLKSSGSSALIHSLITTPPAKKELTKEEKLDIAQKISDTLKGVRLDDADTILEIVSLQIQKQGLIAKL